MQTIESGVKVRKVFLFADNTKIIKLIKMSVNSYILQEGIHNLLI